MNGTVTRHVVMLSGGKDSTALALYLRARHPIIGPLIVDVLEDLQPELTQGENLGELAAKMIESSEALRDTGLRNQIIELLPLPKARELAKRLGVEDGRNLFRDLRHVASDKTALTVLFSFFGVVEGA